MPEEKLINPFCYVPERVDSPIERPKRYRIKSVEVDKDTLSSRPVFEEYDLQAEIDARRNDCGMEQMKALLRNGQATAEDFQDDGKHGFDNTILPSNIHEAKKMADMKADEIAKVAGKVGLPADKEGFTAKELEWYLTQAVQKAFEAQSKKQEVKTDEQGK